MDIRLTGGADLLAAMTRSTIRFLLNKEPVEYGAFGASETLLDYLRLKRALRGTKEGCAEGDCGACTVLVGRLRHGVLVYETVNACIRFMGTLDGCHVVTIEALAPADGQLHPVQQAMVDHHGSQCGFCTPGIVMSLYGLWLQNPDPSIPQIEKALQGNLCRCTGYQAIVQAAKAASLAVRDGDWLVNERGQIAQMLADFDTGGRVDIDHQGEKFVMPADVDDFAEYYAANPGATIVAGATDVGLWVTKQMRDVSPLVYVGALHELQRIHETGTYLSLGAGVTYTQAFPCLARHFPAMIELWDRIGGEQIRNMGTIGGNIANGSPIGDAPPAMITLGATVILRRGSARRRLPLEAYFLSYGQQDRAPGEFVEAVELPLLAHDAKFAVYKVTKRFDEDITTVCGAFKLSLGDTGMVASACITLGGMAATPRRARDTEAALIGKAWSDETVEAACLVMTKDFSPLSDLRATAGYRMLVAQNLLRRFHLETSGAPGELRLQREAAA
jgi:xanthine dehydrogenase small subunit